MVKTTAWRYEVATKTIRSVPENYWIASMNSFEGSVDHEANARLIAAAPRMLDFMRYLTEHTLAWGEVRDRARAILRDVEGESDV